MKKILILGISSFSGSAFADFMLTKNFSVVGTYRRRKNNLYQPHLQNKNIKNFQSFKIDININLKKLLKIIKKYKPQYIIDFASICMVNESWTKPELYLKSNLQSKSLLLKEICNYKFIKKYIYISSPEVFGSNENSIKENQKIFNPSTPYAISKLSFELLLKSYGQSFNLPYTICRFSNFFGIGQPNYRLIPKVILSILINAKFPLHGNGMSKRNFISSFDFSNGIYLTLIKGKNKKTYHFSSNEFFTVKEIIKQICKIKKYSFDKLVKKVKDRTGKDATYKLNYNQTKNELDWKPKIKFNDALKDIIKFYEKNLNKLKQLDTKYIDKNLN